MQALDTDASATRASKSQTSLELLTLRELYFCYVNGRKTPFLDEILEKNSICFNMEILNELSQSLISRGLVNEERNKISLVTTEVSKLSGTSVQDLIEEFCDRAEGYIHLYTLTRVGIRHVQENLGASDLSPKD